MLLQFIHDIKGNTTGVFIPIEDWQNLKTQYVELEIEEIKSQSELLPWQKEILNDRLSDYYKNSSETMDFDLLLKDIEKSL
jgi:hypothetical protein